MDCFVIGTYVDNGIINESNITFMIDLLVENILQENELFLNNVLNWA